MSTQGSGKSWEPSLVQHPVPLKDQVCELLRERIHSGTYSAGDRLVEQRLANEFQISRVPVREALLVLEGEGLVTFIPRKGAVVAGRMSADEIEGLFRVRMALEPLAAQMAAESATADDIAQLRHHLERACKSRETGALAELVEHNARFHDGVVTAAHNISLDLAMAPLTRRLRWRYSADYLDYSSHVDEHDSLLRAIEAHQPDEARNLAQAHVERAKRIVLGQS